MTARSLAIIERSFYGTIEKQYDENLWLAHVLKKMGDDLTLLLRGNAVLYAVSSPEPSSLDIGKISLDHLPDYNKSLQNLVKADIDVFIIAEDCCRLNIKPKDLYSEVKIASTGYMACLLETFDNIWFW